MDFYLDPSAPEALFSEAILHRGASYYHSGAISYFQQTMDGHWIAEVEGTEVYHVNVQPVHDQLWKCSCSCPYAFDAPCKHIAAVWFCIEDKQQELPPRPPSADAPAGSFPSLLRQADRDQLAQFIRQLADYNSHIEQQFIAFMTPSTPGAGKPQYRKIIKAALRPARRKGLVFTAEAKSLLAPVYELLHQAEEQKKAGNIRFPLQIAQVMAEEMVPALNFIDDSHAVAGDTIRWAISLLSHTADQPLEKKEQRAFFKWCLKSADDKRYDGWGFEDQFMDIAIKLADTSQQTRLLEQLLDERIVRFRKDENLYKLEPVVLQKASLLEKTERKDDVLQLLKTFKELPDIRKKLIQVTWSQGDIETVKQLAEEAQILFKEYPGRISEWTNWLLKAADAEGDTGKVLNMMHELLINEPSMENYLNLKNKYPENWTQYLQNELIPEMEQNYPTQAILPEIFLHEQMHGRLLNYLHQHADFKMLSRYGHLFKDKAEPEIFEIYTKLIKQYLKHNTGRKFYKSACSELARASRFCTKSQLFGLIEELGNRHPNRPSLLDELEKFKQNVA